MGARIYAILKTLGLPGLERGASCFDVGFAPQLRPFPVGELAPESPRSFRCRAGIRIWVGCYRSHTPIFGESVH